MFNRRTAIAALMTFPLGYYRAFAQAALPTGRATLTVDLAQWRGITVKLGKRETFISSEEIFAALEEK